MPTYQVAYNPTTKVATVQPNNDALPGGSINIGTFEHDTEADQIGAGDSHVFFHHVRDALYKRNAANPAQVGFWPDNITDMASITIAIDSLANPVPVNSVAPDISGTVQQGQILTTTNGTWSATPTGYTRQWRRADAADGTGNVTNIGEGATTYTLVADDVGKYIFCEVTAANANGSAAAAARSDIVGPVLAL